MAKRYRPGLTEKRMNNKRFRRTEEAILRVFFEEDNYISIGEIAKKVGVARSTFYHHHRAMREIIPDYEKFLLAKYRRRIWRLLKNKETKMGVLFFTMLIFVEKHRETFAVLLANNRTEVIAIMVEELIPKIGAPMGLPKNSERIVRVYVSEVVELVKIWGEKGFRDEEIERMLGEIMFLTETARIRLKPLIAR